MNAARLSLPAAADALLAERLAGPQPKGILVISTTDLPVTADCLQGRELVHVTCHSLPEALASGRRFSVGILLDALASMSRDDGTMLLAQLRDQLCERVFVVSAEASAWPREEMLALGYTLSARSADTQWLLHEHDIATYNPEREWNTPEHWANPENFSRYRW